MNETKTAVIHARVSDRKQADRNLSVPGQVEAGKKRAEELGAKVLEVFIEGKARSAWRGNRPELEDAITYCEVHGVDYFITWDTARFSRDISTGPSNRLRLRAAGTFIEYITVKIDPTTEEGFILENIYQLTDELKSRKTSTDTKRSMIKNAEAGFWNGGRVPFGYLAVPDGKRKRLDVNKEEAKIVRKIFKLKAYQGMGARGIASWLNERGIKNRDRRWSKTAIHELLRNEVFIGRTVFGRKDRQTGRIRDRSEWVIVNSHKPIVSADLWETVQRQINMDTPVTEAGSPHSTYLFTGLLKCGECGAAMQIESAKGRSKRYWYYNCRAAALEKKHKPRRIPAREIDDFLIDELCERIFNKKAMLELIEELNSCFSNWAKDRSKRSQDVVNKIKGVESKQSKLFEVLELYGKDAPNMSDIAARLRSHNDEIKKLEEQLVLIENEKPPENFTAELQAEELTDLLTSIVKTTKNPKKIRDFLSGFITAIYVEEKEVRLEYKPHKMLIGPPKVVPSKSVWLPGTGSNRRPGD